MKKYKWKLEEWKTSGKRYGVEASTAMKELKRIETKYGKVTPELVVEESTSKRAILHKFFEWDNDKAAYRHRMQQARLLINGIEVVIISSGQSKRIGAFEVVTTSAGKSYRDINHMTQENIEEIRFKAKRELNSLKNKLDFYKELKKASGHIGKAIAELCN